MSCTITAGVVKSALPNGKGLLEITNIDPALTSGSIKAQLEARGAVSWTVALPATARPITAALGPLPDSARHVAFIVNRESGFDVHHARYTAGRRPESFQSVRVDHGFVLDASSLALFVDRAGVVTVGVVSCGGADRRACSLVEASFGADDTAGTAKVTPLGSVAATPVATAVLYAERNANQPRRAVAVQLETGQVLKMEGTALVPASPGTPTSPLLLVPGKETIYLLYVDPAGLHLESM